MSIDDDIIYCKGLVDFYEYEASKYEKSDSYKHQIAVKYAEEYKQRVEWLRELKFYKDRQDLINKSWQELIRYKEGIEKIKMRSQSYRECGESILANGMEQALDILEEVNADGKYNSILS